MIQTSVETFEALLGRLMSPEEVIAFKVTQALGQLFHAALDTREALLQAGFMNDAEEATVIAWRAQRDGMIWATKLRTLLLASARPAGGIV